MLKKYEEPLASPLCNTNDIKETLPDFMWSQHGRKHLEKLMTSKVYTEAKDMIHENIKENLENKKMNLIGNYNLIN